MPETNQTVSLGCGTLILIAVIVMIFSNNRGDVADEVRRLRNDVQDLTKEVEDLRTTLQAQRLPAEVPGD